jgi:hypothetical protein
MKRGSIAERFIDLRLALSDAHERPYTDLAVQKEVPIGNVFC